VQTIPLALKKLVKERHFATAEGAAKLGVGETVDLY
jgi:hypothetical protein